MATSAGISKFASAASGTSELTFDTSGPGAVSSPCALTFGADGMLYALDTGQHEVLRYNPADGSYLGSFALTGTTDPSALAIGPTGLLYTANGDGGGSVYNEATGAFLENFTSTTSNPNPDGGRTWLAVDDAGHVYLDDAATGVHSFLDTSVVTPEPSGLYLLMFGLAGWALFRRRSRSYAPAPSSSS